MQLHVLQAQLISVTIYIYIYILATGTATTGISACAIGGNCCLNFSALASADITNFSDRYKKATVTDAVL